MRFLGLLAAVLLGAACSEGARAFRAGAYRAAFASFDAAVAERGASASAALHYDRALAALRCGEWAAVDESLEAARTRSGEDWDARLSFLRGCASALRAEEAARAAALPDAIPADWDLALARGRAALDGFAAALASREGDWPAARRNAARILLQLEAWERARAAAAPPRSEPAPRPEPARVEALLQRLERLERPPERTPDIRPVERDW